MPGDTIELYKPEDGNSLTITSGSSEFNLVTLHPDDFSLVEQIHDQDHVNIDSFAMKELIDLTNYAAATDEKSSGCNVTRLNSEEPDVIVKEFPSSGL